jgi:hypothetical protein
MWRNWQTRQIQVLVGVKSLGGSTPLIRIQSTPFNLLAAIRDFNLTAGTSPAWRFTLAVSRRTCPRAVV